MAFKSSDGSASPRAPYGGMARIHWLLTAQSVILVLLTLNRLTNLTTGYVAANQFLRWQDLHNLLTLPLLSLAAFYFLKVVVESEAAPGSERARTWIGLAFLLGVYVYGAGYGVHEVTNYLHIRFCPSVEAGAATEDLLCAIIAYNDDLFSHYAWFIGFIVVNAALLFLQATTAETGRLGTGNGVLLLANALFVAAAIFANLAFETIGLDLYIVAVVAVLAIYFLLRRGRRPLFVYYAAAYGIGLAVTGLYLWLGPG